MAQDQTDTHSVSSAPPKPSAAKVRKLKRPTPGPREKPAKSLPTDRITFQRQLDILRAYAAASGASGKKVTNIEAAELVKMVPGTTTLANAFFIETGLLIRSDGAFLPGPDVISFHRNYEWNPETAVLKLAPTIRGSWFGEVLTKKLSYKPMEEAEAITTLAETARAGPIYRSQLKICIEYMVASGIILRDGGLLRLRADVAQPSEAAIERPAESREPAPRSAIMSTFNAQPTEGVVQFHVSVKVDMKEFEGWQPERIASFFSGIAQVLAAKGAIEKGAGSTS